MKKVFIYIISSALALASFSACDMFRLDNFDGPDAQVTGRLLDVQTGEKIGVEAATTVGIDWSTWSYVTTVECGALVVVEQGWAGEEDQDWLVRYDGQFTNNLIFAADYTYSTKKLPCYEPENNAITIKKGPNTLDLELLPYCRIVEPEITVKKDAFGNYSKIVATFKVELTDATKANKVANVAFCGNTQIFVGCNYQNLASGDAGAKKKNVTPGTKVTLEIDMNNSKNADLFQYTRDRYFRIAAMANGNGYNTGNNYNFSPVYRISADFETIEEVEWTENK